MSETIHKYDVRMDAEGSRGVIEAPVGAKIVSVAFQHGQLRAWAAINPDVGFNELFDLFVVGTGHPLPKRASQFLNRIDHNGLVFHVFLPGASQ